VRALIISKTKIDNDPRPKRQIEYFGKEAWKIDTLTCQDTNSPAGNKYELKEDKGSGLKFIFRILILILRRFDLFHRTGLSYDQSVNKNKYDLILAHDLITLPVAFNIKASQNNFPKVIVDLHEYLPSQRENSLSWRVLYQPFVNYLAKTYLPKVDGAVTVNASIAQKYMEVFKVDKPEVVRNIPKKLDNLLPSERNDGKIKIIHHGVAFPSRGTEEMIKMMEYLNPADYNLTFMLVNDEHDPYLLKLKETASRFSNIEFIKPVKFSEIPNVTNKYDIGLFLLPPLTYNYHYALPNKLFEFIQARLAIAIGPSPEMKNIVEKYQVGVVSESFDPSSLANAIKILSKTEIQKFKQNAHKASATLHADEEMSIYTNFVKKICSQKN
jgi:hypothetical protein